MLELLSNPIVILILNFIFGASGIIFYVLGWLRSRKKEKAETTIKETEAGKGLREDAEASFKKWQEKEREYNKLLIEKESASMLLQVKEQMIANYIRDMKEILIDHGKAIEAEKNTRERFAEHSLWNEELKKLHQKIEELNLKLANPQPVVT